MVSIVTALNGMINGSAMILPLPTQRLKALGSNTSDDYDMDCYKKIRRRLKRKHRLNIKVPGRGYLIFDVGHTNIYMKDRNKCFVVKKP